MSTGIIQVELRWTDEEQQGFSIVAHSETFDSDRWKRRLKPIARPPKIKQSITAVYKIFDEEAALIFRLSTQPPDSAEFPDEQDSLHASEQTARDDLITRVLVGPRELLKPEVALASSFIGCPEFLAPPPGKVAEKTVLPALQPAILDAEIQPIPSKLDALARKDPALDSLIEAALTAPTIPLTLQLPEHEVGTQSTIGLLWGLWRTANPILADLPSWQWSFSTGEAPLGNTDTSPLPNLIVHRLRNSDDPPPTVQRTQRIVKPRASDTADKTTEEAIAAHLLATAYRSLPINDFSDRLQNIRAYGITRAARLAAIPVELNDFRKNPAASIIGGGTSATERGPANDKPQHPAGAKHRAEVPALLNDAFPHEELSLESIASPATQHMFDSFSHLFARLAAGDDDFELALDQIVHKQERGEKPDHKERAHLRTVMDREGWFVYQFDRMQTYDVSHCVALLLDLVVKPDIADPACRPQLIKQLCAWVINERTPTVVVLALDDLIIEQNDYELQRALIPGMGYRWRRDHARYRVLAGPAPASSKPGAPKHQAPRWLLFKGEQIPAKWANAIAGICVIELIVFAVLLVIRR